jgi:hypothetical protein
MTDYRDRTQEFAEGKLKKLKFLTAPRNSGSEKLAGLSFIKK